VNVRRLARFVSAVVLLDTSFYAVVAPLLPRYADDLGLSKGAAGVLSGAYPAGTLLGALPAGWLATRIGTRASVGIGLGLLGASSVVFGVAHDIVLLDAARFAQGLGGACSWAGGFAWLLETAPADRRGELIGTALGAAIAGEVLGPALGAVAEATSPAAVFAVIPVLAATLGAWATRLPSPPVGVPQSPAPVLAALRRPELAVGVWLVALPSLAFGCLAVLAPLRLSGLGAGGTAVAATFIVAAALEAALSPAIGRFSDRRGRLTSIRIGLVAAVPLLLLFSTPDTALGLAALVVASFLALGAFWGPAMAMLADAAERVGVRLAYAFALVNLAWAGGQVAGAAGGGALADRAGDLVPFVIIAALCLATRVALR
jgi:MFS family permease